MTVHVLSKYHTPIFDQLSVMCGCYFPKGLNTLQNLKELNLADNIIEKIGRFIESSLLSVPTLIAILWAVWGEKNKKILTSFQAIALILMSAFRVLICPGTRSAPLR